MYSEKPVQHLLELYLEPTPSESDIIRLMLWVKAKVCLPGGCAINLRTKTELAKTFLNNPL
jgi:hypothetical protein